jgi:hypothetical protein
MKQNMPAIGYLSALPAGVLPVALGVYVRDMKSRFEPRRCNCERQRHRPGSD